MLHFKLFFYTLGPAFSKPPLLSKEHIKRPDPRTIKDISARQLICGSNDV